MSGQYVLCNPDIMRNIYLFDPTYKLIFTEHFIANNIILKAANLFWYKKYIKLLNMYRNTDSLQAIKNILEVQRGFFDTVEQLQEK